MKHFSAVPGAGAIICAVLVCTLFSAAALSCTTADPARKFPDMVADRDPLTVGTIEAQFDRTFSSRLAMLEIKTIFYPRLNSVALEFRHEFITYRQFWSEEARKQFAAALELYKADYEARNLQTRYNRTRGIYGKVKGRVEWETFSGITQTRQSSPTIEFGYRFRNNSPFFAVNMNSAKEDKTSGPSQQRVDSSQVIMYFTRAQADYLARLFDQAHLMGTIGLRQDEPAKQTLMIIDDYTEYDGQGPVDEP
jgi:hypothetical protein